MPITNQHGDLNQTFSLKDFSDNENQEMNRPDDQKTELKGVFFFILYFAKSKQNGSFSFFVKNKRN